MSGLQIEINTKISISHHSCLVITIKSLLTGYISLCYYITVNQIIAGYQIYSKLPTKLVTSRAQLYKEKSRVYQN